jgi:uncharacterized iron-regulated protein
VARASPRVQLPRVSTRLIPFALGLGLLLPGCISTPHPRSLPLPELWVDLVDGDEAEPDDVLADLATADAVYVGETHSIARHHAVQLSLLQQLFARNVRLVLCLEQLEAADQPAVDRYNRREIDFAGLAREINWAGKWNNYADYRSLCEFAQQHGIPIAALNAPPDAIRAVSRGGGVAHLTPELRARLPADLALDDPLYEKVTNLQLAIHMAVDPAKLRPMFEAQMVRDETMGANIVAARRRESGIARTAFVIVGAGHMRYGLGTPASVRRREPGVIERLVLVSESGQLQLSAAEKAASRETHISHSDLRALNRPPADYLRLLPLAATKLPPGHPPIGDLQVHRP